MNSQKLTWGCIIKSDSEQEKKKNQKEKNETLEFQIFSNFELIEISNRTMDEQIKMQNENTEIRTISTTDENELISSNENKRFSPFCRSDCIVCNCPNLIDIHNWRPEHTFISLSEKIKNELQLEISKDQLHRHFQYFNKKMTGEIARHIANFDLQIETLSEHQRRVLFLGKVAYDDILKRIEQGTMPFTLDDFEKIMKLFYGTMKDPSAAVSNSNQIVNLFVEAANRGGAPINQPPLEFETESRRTDNTQRLV